MRRIIYTIFILVVVLVAVGIAMNWEYVVKRAEYTFKYAPAKETPDPEQKREVIPDQLRIPSLNIEAPIKYVTEKDEAVFQTALAEGVVHYPDTATPGQAGNVYIFGHSSDLAWSKGEYKTVFALLPQIKIGEEIFVSDNNGKEYTYTVTGTRVVSPKDLSVLDQGNYEKRVLSLQTSYPVGTALKRFVVTAELVEE
jgi:sortase A